MSCHSLLSNAQRQAILTAQFDLDERQGARYGTWSDQDLLRMDRRRDSNRCGFAVPLCLLGFPGWPPKRRDRVPRPLLLYVAEQWGKIYRYGIPFDRKVLVTSDPGQSEYIEGQGFAKRCADELGYVPYRLLARTSAFDLEFLPLRDSLQSDPRDPLDP